MTDFITTLDAGVVDWARAQFALTAIYHWIFVPLTLGLAVVMGIMETMYYRTGSEMWKQTTKFWQKLFGINFCVGIATGLVVVWFVLLKNKMHCLDIILSMSPVTF